MLPEMLLSEGPRNQGLKISTVFFREIWQDHEFQELSSAGKA